VSGLLSICTERGCGRLYEKTDRRVHRCREHQAELERRDNARRNRKQWRQGRNTARWRQLRAAALARDGHQCRRCGSSDDLTVHLNPQLAGDHEAATLDDLETLCRRCHGQVDGARSRQT
jgi:5-methylcytosine-specific restriction endonuclease McrA